MKMDLTQASNSPVAGVVTTKPSHGGGCCTPLGLERSVERTAASSGVAILFGSDRGALVATTAPIGSAGAVVSGCLADQGGDIDT